jgi:hypothetical protein
MCGLDYVFDVVIRKLHPTVRRGRARFDGAGCFAGQILTLAQRDWFEWTGFRLEETSSNVEGDGKSAMDRAFSEVGDVMTTSKNLGQDLLNAEQCAAALTARGGLLGANVAIFTPDRSAQAKTVPRKDRVSFALANNRRIKLVTRGGIEGYLCFRNSRFGDGEFISESTAQDSVKWKDDDKQERPKYSVREVVATPLPLCEEKPSSRVLKSAHSREVAAKKGGNKRSRKEAAKNKSEEDKIDQVEARGAFVCRARETFTNACCRGVFVTEAGMKAHAAGGVHDYPRHRTLDRTLYLSASGSVGVRGSFAQGANYNRKRGVDGAQLPAPCVTLAAVPPPVARIVIGWAIKPPSRDPYRKKEAQKQFLTDLFNEGNRRSSSKYTATAAYELMKTKKVESGARRGFRFFSHSHEHDNGIVLSVEQIKEFFSRLAKEQKRRGAAQGTGAGAAVTGAGAGSGANTAVAAAAEAHDGGAEESKQSANQPASPLPPITFGEVTTPLRERFRAGP